MAIGLGRGSGMQTVLLKISRPLISRLQVGLVVVVHHHFLRFWYFHNNFCLLATFQTPENQFGMDCGVKLWFLIIRIKYILLTVHLKSVKKNNDKPKLMTIHPKLISWCLKSHQRIKQTENIRNNDGGKRQQIQLAKWSGHPQQDDLRCHKRIFCPDISI